MLSRKPRMLITMAPAHKTARIVWAILFKQQDYKAPMAIVASDLSRPEVVGGRQASKESMAQQSVKRSLANQGYFTCHEHAELIGTILANSHTVPQQLAAREAGQMAASDRSTLPEFTTCTLRGVHR